MERTAEGAVSRRAVMGVMVRVPVRVFFFFFFFFLRETTNLENRILHGRGGCRRNCGGETGASPPT